MRDSTQSPGSPRGWQTFPLPNVSHANRTKPVEFADLLPSVLMRRTDGTVLVVSGQGLILGTIQTPVWFDELADRLVVSVLSASDSARRDGFNDCLLLRGKGDTPDQYFERLRKLAELAFPAKSVIADSARSGEVKHLP